MTHHHHGGSFTHSHFAVTAEGHSDLGKHDCSQYTLKVYEPCERAAEGGEWGHDNCVGTGRPEEGIADCACPCHKSG